MQKPTYAFDTDGHTIIGGQGILVCLSNKEFQKEQDDAARADTVVIEDAIAIDPKFQKRYENRTHSGKKATTPEWLSQVLNEGDGVYRP